MIIISTALVDILCHQTLRNSQTACDSRDIQFGVSHKDFVELSRLTLVKESLKAQILIDVLPMQPVLICLIIGTLLLGCIS